MLRIRKEQLDALEHEACRGFEMDMLEHLRTFSPRMSDLLGVSGSSRVVRLGIERAEGYGFTCRGPIRLYIELMILFGSAFDRDPLLPWATEILNARTIGDEMFRAEHLYDSARKYLSVVAGPENAYAKRALDVIIADRARNLFCCGLSYKTHLISYLGFIYPEKAVYAGEPALDTLIGMAESEARGHSLDSNAGIVLFTGLMFAFGCGFASDPRFSWISAMLANPSIIGPRERIERLLTKTLAYLKHTRL
jgi:hypothetical protein